MKKMTKLLMSGFVLATLTACGNGASQTQEASDTLKILLSEEPSAGAALTVALDEWAEETNHKVESIVIPYDDQLTKFPLMLKNNDVPDLVSTTRLTMLYPDEFMDLKEKIDTTIFDETALSIINNDYSKEHVLGAPQQYTITTYYYNKDAFEKAGIKVPTEEEPWTMDELYANAETLQKVAGIKYGFAVDFSRARYDNLMYSNGGSLVLKEDDTYQVNANSPENVETLEKFIAMNDSGVLPKVIWTGGSSDNPADYFKNGDVGIYLSGSWNYQQLNTDINAFNFGVMPSPKGTVQQSAITGGSALAIPQNAVNSELAVEFLNWLYQEENFKSFLANDNGLSFVNGIINQADDPNVQADYETMQAEMEHVTTNFMTDEESLWRNHLDNEYRDALKQAVSGELSAQEALDNFAKNLSEKSSWGLKK